MREPEGLLPNSLAIAYAITAQIAGLFLITRNSVPAIAPGILLTAHSMVIASYLIHECAHMTLFRAQALNRRVGELMAWLSGVSYASFERIRHFHIRHHRDRADVARFDYKAFLLARSPLSRRVVYALEWAYIPAIELIMHAQVIAQPFTEARLRPERRRVLLTLVSRAALFSLLFAVHPLSLLWFALAYLLFVSVMSFFDAFHHTFEQYYIDDENAPLPMQGKDRVYEQANTYSNLLSVSHPWLNWLTLNFNYHNAHHERASTPWYRLPALHRELYGDENKQLITFCELLHTFHHNRLCRILDDGYGDIGEGVDRADRFVGAHGVSLLTVV
jgi:fatty acid desaturase